jgi:hypothetical protein
MIAVGSAPLTALQTRDAEQAERQLGHLFCRQLAGKLAEHAGEFEAMPRQSRHDHEVRMFGVDVDDEVLIGRDGVVTTSSGDELVANAGQVTLDVAIDQQAIAVIVPASGASLQGESQVGPHAIFDLQESRIVFDHGQPIVVSPPPGVENNAYGTYTCGHGVLISIFGTGTKCWIAEPGLMTHTGLPSICASHVQSVDVKQTIFSPPSAP